MNSAELNKQLLGAFPELKESFDVYTNWQDGIDTGSFLVFEDIFVPFIVKAVATKDEERLSKIADFIEGAYSSDDEYVKNVIYVGVLESLKSRLPDSIVSTLLHGESKAAFENLTF